MKNNNNIKSRARENTVATCAHNSEIVCVIERKKLACKYRASEQIKKKERKTYLKYYVRMEASAVAERARAGVDMQR